MAAPAIAALADWAPRNGPATSLHAGDVGWFLRLDDADLDGRLILARDGRDIVAVAIVEPGLLRPTLRPDCLDDIDLATALGELAESVSGAEVFCDAPTQSALRAWLAGRGWDVDPDPWALLYRPLTAADADVSLSLAAPVGSEDDIADRVAVQFNAFERSTFTVQRWRQMAAGPAYRRDLDLLRRDDDGTPVAGATAWLAGPGRVGILEPVGTHRDHVGRGHGRAVTEAAIAALATAGASGVTVQTPLSNPAAVHTYQRCGLRIIDHLRTLRHLSSDS
jgi:GNAT superfamily N-acetyltransferase